jgi:hypothetical protein
LLHMQDLGWREIKDLYVRPSYLPLSFTLGALTIGLRLGAANYTFTDSVSECCIIAVVCADPSHNRVLHVTCTGGSRFQ